MKKSAVLLLYALNTASIAFPQKPVLPGIDSIITAGIIAPGAPLPYTSLAARMKSRRVNGLSITVIDQGNIAWSKGFGLANADDPQDTVSPQTLFQMGSIGKLLTAITVLHLVREHKISLDEDVNNKLQSWKVPVNDHTAQHPVTVRNLLSHSAGLTDEYGFEGYYPHTELPTLLQILNAQKPANNEKPLRVNKVPGTVELYSGGGYVILQQLVEDLTGQSFAGYVTQTVLQPLQMTHTTYNYYPDESGAHIATGHESNGKTDPKRRYNVYPEMAPAGPWTTPEDIARLLLEIQAAANGRSDKILDSTLARTMLTPQINNMGLGPHLSGAAAVQAFWHAGNTAGFVCLAYGLPYNGQGAVVMTNSDGGEWLSLEIIRSIARAYHWPVMQPYTLQPLNDSTMAAFSGNYATDRGKISITAKAGNLFLKTGTGQNLPLLYLGGDSCTIRDATDKFRLVLDRSNSGAVSGLHIYQHAGSGNMVFTKLL
ncbi:CubicO group peptidase, beta-lactamase class C family [Chitinophaga costaii]|uniref:CubicO group peptidase, beta-lactamase class C family n=1 Tax=Chitinophaga costaii TaxID=1335309 RepID=A0A1C4ENP8_9BACT|nr:serine hydrolase domain-containing protein [Chitinophaga costaii]PUZ22468.1 hypothetical protein DCM91_14460 [Chitinophaga costaii]SCC45157.1 CubicO group peptidase, beta-lactamase class C family [Chitinophaga costaii]